MPRLTFEVVKYTATKRTKGDDGRMRTRQKTFDQTINPFNKRADGCVKTRSDIMEELRAVAAAWKSAP
jgi:hypothetical protein